MINKFHEAHKELIEDAGLFTFPVNNNKQPIIQGWQKLSKSSEILDQSWKNAQGIGVPAEPNQLEIIDIDSDNADDPVAFRRQVLMALKHSSERFHELVLVETRSGGMHIYYHISDGYGNKKLARNMNGVVLIETRGYGGYVVAPPSEGYTLVQGEMSDIPTLSTDERDEIIAACEDFNEYIPQQKLMKRPKRDSQQEQSVFLKYNEQADMVAILSHYGYTYVDTTPEGTRMLRPNGKSKHSLMIFANTNLAYVHSTSCAPLETDTPYTAMDIHLLLGNAPRQVVIAQILNKMNVPEFVQEDVVTEGLSVKAMPIYSLTMDVGQKGKWPIDGTVLQQLFDMYELTFRNNVINSNVEVLNNVTHTWSPVLAEHINSLWLAISPKYKVSVSDIKQAIFNDIVSPEVDPIEDFWNEQKPWDGVDRMPALIKELNPVNADTAELYLRKWMLGFYRQSLGAGQTNEIILTIVGGQGVGKDRFIETLMPRGLKDYFATSNLNGSDRDANVIMAGNLIVNVSEGDIVVNNKKGVEWIKTLASSDKLTMRRLHSQTMVTQNRRASLTMTSNELGVLNDSTGNRRFAVIESKKINYEHDVDINQVYAQIREQETKHWFSQDDIKLMAESSEAYRQVSIEEEAVLRFFKPAENDSPYQQFWMTSEVMNHIQLHTTLRIGSVTLGKVLVRLFGDLRTTTRVNGKPRKCYQIELIDPNPYMNND